MGDWRATSIHRNRKPFSTSFQKNVAMIGRDVLDTSGAFQRALPRTNAKVFVEARYYRRRSVMTLRF
jgi:hypothetical protein